MENFYPPPHNTSLKVGFLIIVGCQSTLDDPDVSWLQDERNTLLRKTTKRSSNAKLPKHWHRSSDG